MTAFLSGEILAFVVDHEIENEALWKIGRFLDNDAALPDLSADSHALSVAKVRDNEQVSDACLMPEVACLEI